MSIKERKEEAEAVLDSAEMVMETYPGGGEKKRELERKIHELEQELQDPDSEKSLKELIDDIRELMDELQDQPMEEDSMGGDPGLGPQEGGMGPGGPEEPPF